MKTISEALDTLLQPEKLHPEWANRPALIGSDKLTLSFSDLQQRITAFAHALAKIGVSKNDRVIISAPNSPEYIAVLLALWKLGATAIPIDCRLSTKELANLLNRLEPKAFIGASEYCQMIEQTEETLPTNNVQVLDFARLAAQNTNKLEPGMNIESAHFVILTSGTTGMPKGALHDMSTLVTNLIELGELASIKPGMTLLLPLPLSHIFGLEVCLVGLLYGASVSFTSTADDFFAALRTTKFDIVAGVPALYSSILLQPEEIFDFSHCQILLSGGAPLPNSLADQFRKRFNKRLNNGYGSTEIKIIALNLDGPDLSVGRTIPSARVRIMDTQHQVLPDGQVGEICIEGNMLMKGYFRQVKETEAVLHHGHYHTGDLGYLKDGYLFIAGRDKELINVGGNKVFPSEVEDVLRRHENVKEVAVFGVPHYRLGQLVKAVIVIKDADLSKQLEGSEQSYKEARQHLLSSFKEFCMEHLKKELRPLAWEFRPMKEALPKTMTGKIDKKKL